MNKKAVILFNLGGPDKLDAVRPFLFNLFNDRAIINIIQPFRFFLAHFISWMRKRKACNIYAKMGGASSIVPNTASQASLLEIMLNTQDPTAQYKVFFAMRYWHPRVASMIDDVAAFEPNDIILMPLYPQFSISTTASSFEEWNQYKNSKKELKHINQVEICCYPDHPMFVEAYADLIMQEMAIAEAYRKPRVIFSANGLPMKQILAGDPYEHHIHKSAHAIAQHIGLQDWRISYQSKVGPLAWLGPSTQSEIKNAAADGVPVIIVPIAFVSEHSETKVELDIDYAKYARDIGIKCYRRVDTLGTYHKFIKCLASLCLNTKSNACAESICNKDEFKLCYRCKSRS